MDFHTKPGKERGRVRLVAGVSTAELGARIALFTPRKMYV